VATIAEIHDHLGQWLDGRISLREFEDWFVPSTWDVHRRGEPDLESLADEIELNLSEYSDGVVTLPELRREMANAIRPSFEETGSAEAIVRVVFSMPAAQMKISEMKTSETSRFLKLRAALA
jgi:hypothetical protein